MFDEFPAIFVATKEVDETKGKNYIYILLFSMKFPTKNQEQTMSEPSSTEPIMQANISMQQSWKFNHPLPMNGG